MVYAISACRLASFAFRKHLLKFTEGEGLFYLLHRGGACGTYMALEILDWFSGVLITFVTTDLHILLN